MDLSTRLSKRRNAHNSKKKKKKKIRLLDQDLHILSLYACMQLKAAYLVQCWAGIRNCIKCSLLGYQSGSLPVLSGNLGNLFAGIDEGTEAGLVL